MKCFKIFSFAFLDYQATLIKAMLKHLASRHFTRLIIREHNPLHLLYLGQVTTPPFHTAPARREVIFELELNNPMARPFHVRPGLLGILVEKGLLLAISSNFQPTATYHNLQLTQLNHIWYPVAYIHLRALTSFKFTFIIQTNLITTKHA